MEKLKKQKIAANYKILAFAYTSTIFLFNWYWYKIYEMEH